MTTLTHGHITHAIWCTTCNKPAAIEVNIYTLDNNGPHHIGTLTQCQDCDDET